MIYLKANTKQQITQKSLFGVWSHLVYPSKSFKVNPDYRTLYETIFNIVDRDKSLLLNGLLTEFIGKENTLLLKRYDFNELIETMILDLEQELKSCSYEEIKVNVVSHPRMIAIYNEFQKTKRKKILTSISFRISEGTTQKIYTLKQNTLGEVIELAVALFVVNCQELIFDLILLTIKHQENVQQPNE